MGRLFWEHVSSTPDLINYWPYWSNWQFPWDEKSWMEGWNRRGKTDSDIATGEAARRYYSAKGVLVTRHQFLLAPNFISKHEPLVLVLIAVIISTAVVGGTIYISGQVGHDETGKIVGRGDMEAQMRQTYINIQKILTQYGATMDNIVDEILFVTDMDAAFSAAVKCRKDVFSSIPVVASTIVQIQRLAFPELLIEIRCTARV